MWIDEATIIEISLKIMRRILRKIAEDDFGSLGDTSTLAEPVVVNDLIENRENRKD